MILLLAKKASSCPLLIMSMWCTGMVVHSSSSDVTMCDDVTMTALGGEGAVPKVVITCRLVFLAAAAGGAGGGKYPGGSGFRGRDKEPLATCPPDFRGDTTATWFPTGKRL